MLSLIHSYFIPSPEPQVSPDPADPTVPSASADPADPTIPSASSDLYDPILQTILDTLLLDTRIQSKYNLTIETSTENPNKNHTHTEYVEGSSTKRGRSSFHLLIYPQRHINNTDPTVYNPYVLDDPIDFFFKLTIESNLQTRIFPSKRTLRIHVFSIEKDQTYLGLSFSNEKYPWISREPNHTQTISLDDHATVDVPAIQLYINQTYYTIRTKLLNAIPEVLDITQHYCANCKCKLQGGGWNHRNY